MVQNYYFFPNLRPYQRQLQRGGGGGMEKEKIEKPSRRRSEKVFFHVGNVVVREFLFVCCMYWKCKLHLSRCSKKLSSERSPFSLV